MGVRTGEDPLTCDIHEIFTFCTWPRTNTGRCLLCDAIDVEEHKDYCSWSPIYAGLVHNYLDTLDWRLWLDMTMVSTKTVINCAQCGRERLAKDLDVVYRQPSYNNFNNISLIPWKIPQNIVKAICPEHNRKGKVGWVHER